MKPLLCADIGNSHTTWGCSTTATSSTTGGWRPTSAAPPTSGACCSSGLLNDSPVEGISGAGGLCDGAGGAARVARHAAEYYRDVPQVVVEPGVRTGVPVLMDNPREVGTDRIVNALAAA